jgi:hypothetical protein
MQSARMLGKGRQTGCVFFALCSFVLFVVAIERNAADGFFTKSSLLEICVVYLHVT